MEFDIKDILGFNFKKDGYSISAAPALDDTAIKRNMARLHKCTQDLLEGDSTFSYEDCRKALEIIREAYKNAVPAQQVLIEHRLLRSLSYNLGLEQEYDFIKYVIRVFETNWSIAFAKGLIHSLLHDWEAATEEARIALSSSIVNKLRESEAKSARLLLDISPYIQEGGPRRLGTFLRKQNLPFKSAVSLFYLPDSKLGYSFFSEVIVSYFEKMGSKEIPEATRVLKLHNNVTTDKRLLPLMIINNERNLSQDLVDFAISRIGDPSIDSKWAPFKNATVKETENLEKGRRIILAFLSAQVINIFFKKLCDDPARKKFWLKHTKKISDFKVYGPSAGYATMSCAVDAAVLRRHYITLQSRSNTSALVMYFGQYAIIEFSDVGALYVYKQDSSLYKSVFNSHIEKVDDLKISSLGTLVDEQQYRTYYQEEGRMVHIGHWERRMESWLRRTIKA